MNKNIVIGVITVAVGTVLFFKSPSSEKEQAPVQAVKQAQPAAKNLVVPTPSLKSLKASKIQAAHLPQSQTPLTGPDRCQLLSGVKNKYAPEAQENLSECLQFLSSSNFLFKGKLADGCFKPGATAATAPRTDCLELIKAFLLADSILNSSPEQWDRIDDASLLTGMKAFLENFSDGQAEKFSSFIDYMSNRLPNDGSVAKAALLPLKANTRVEMLDHLQQNIEKAARLNPEDPEIVGAEMLLALSSGEKNVLEHLNAFNRENPKSGVGLVYAAAIYHMQGRPDLARAAILAARKDKSPHVQKQVKMALDAINGKSDKVSILVLDGVETKVPVAHLNQWVRSQ